MRKNWLACSAIAMSLVAAPVEARQWSPAAPAAVILITYATTEDAVRRALKAIENHRVITGVPQLIRIEKD